MLYSRLCVHTYPCSRPDPVASASCSFWETGGQLITTGYWIHGQNRRWESVNYQRGSLCALPLTNLVGTICIKNPRFDWPRTFLLNGNWKASGTGPEASAIVVTLPGVFIPSISCPSVRFPRSLKLIHALYLVETLNRPVNLWNLGGSTLS